MEAGNTAGLTFAAEFASVAETVALAKTTDPGNVEGVHDDVNVVVLLPAMVCGGRGERPVHEPALGPFGSGVVFKDMTIDATFAVA